MNYDQIKVIALYDELDKIATSKRIYSAIRAKAKPAISKIDPFWPSAPGRLRDAETAGSLKSRLIKKLYKAKTDKDKLKIYKAVGVLNMGKAEAKVKRRAAYIESLKTKFKEPLKSFPKGKAQEDSLHLINKNLSRRKSY